MRSLAAHVLHDLAGRVREGACVSLVAHAPARAVEDFLAVPIDGAVLLWDRAGGEPWALAGRGEIARIEADGASPVSAIGELAACVFAAVLEHREPGTESVPALRAFGGVAFSTGAGDPGPWSGFADASFTLPRWLYGRHRDGRAYARLTVRGRELGDPVALCAEIDRVYTALEGGADGDRNDAPASGGRLEEIPREAWDALVVDALKRIRTGEFEKVVAARRSFLGTERPIDLGLTLRRLGEAFPDCTRFAFERAGRVFIGATPERLVESCGLAVETDALAGSVVRVEREGLDADAVAVAARALLASDKDRREHEMVVRGIAGALRPLCSDLEIPPEPRVRTLRNVQHLWTPVRGHLRARAHVLSLVEALHPTPAVCGLPRSTAARWIAAREPAPRGWYAAPVGWFDAAGDGAFAVAIRSALLDARGAWLFAGAGIVEGSDPALEYAETSAKQAAMLAALGVGA